MANVLGAPTEGLGQNITFAPQDVGAQALDLGIQQGAVQTGIRGGPAGIGGTQVSGVQGQAYSSPVLDTLLGLAGKAAQARIKEKKTEAYVAGMQRAANGEAIAEIAKDQPWYATMFGDTDVVEGARWYASHTVAQETASAFDEDMQNLRRLGPDGARTEMTARIQERLTGDAQTDAAILQSMTQVMPGIFKRHAKEHAGFLNEEAATAMSASVQAAGRRLQVVARNRAPSPDMPGYSQKELETTLAQFYASQAKPPGMTDKTYNDIKVNSLEHMARQGNFHAISALEAGGWVDAALPMEERDKFRAVVAREQEKAKTKWGAANTEQIARIETWAAEPSVGQDSYFIKAEIDKLRRKMGEETGIDSGYFSPEREAALMARSAVGIYQAKEREHDKALQAAERQAEAGDTAAKEATLEMSIRQAIVDRSLPQLLSRPGVSKDAVDGTVFNILFKENTDPKQRAATMAQIGRENGYSSPLIKQHFERTISSALGAADASSGVMPDAFLGAYREYKELRAYGPETAAQAYGKYATRLESLYLDEQANIPIQQGYFSFLQADEKRAKLPAKDLQKAVSTAAATLRPGVFGLYTKELHPSAARQLALSIEDPAARWVGSVHGASLEDAVKVSLKSPAARNLEVIGQYIIHGSDQTTKLRQYMTGTDGPNGRGALPTDKWEDVFDDAVDEVVNGKDGRYGALLDQKAHIVMRQLPDKNGVPHIRIDALTSDGDLRVATLSGDDVFTLAQAKRDKMKAAGKTPSGEVLRGRMPRNNLKNIYD
jgi:hypothetical protein